MPPTKKDAVVALHACLIAYQTQTKRSTPLRLWTALTLFDCFFRPLPLSMVLHHMAGLTAVGTILVRNLRHPHRNNFIYLELAFISSHLLQKGKFSKAWKAVHLAIHVFIRWPIILRGVRICEELGLWGLKLIGLGMLGLDAYWLYRALKRPDEKKPAE
jgi:hypothetical protein